MAGSETAIYSADGILKKYSGAGGANADELLIDQIDAITPSGGATINLFTSLVAGTDTINIGGGGAGGCKVDIGGDLEVSGDETIVGDTTFAGNTQIGDAVTDTVTFIAKVGDVTNPDMTFQTSAAAQKITTDGINPFSVESNGANLNLQTVTSGNVNILPATNNNVAITTTGTGSCSINTGSGDGEVSIGAGDTGAVSIESGAASEFKVTTGSLTLSTVTSGDLTLIGADNTSIDAGAVGTLNVGQINSRPIDMDGTTIEVDGSTNVNINSGQIFSDGTNVGIGQTSFSDTSWFAQITGTGVNNSEVLLLDSTFTGAGVAGLHVGTGDPSGSVTGNAGDLWLNTGGSPFFCTGGTAWTEVGTASGFGTLQQTYATGNSIVTNTADGNLIFITGNGEDINITLTDGDMLVTTSASGNFQVDNGTTGVNYILTDHSSTLLTLGSTGTTDVSVTVDTDTLTMDADTAINVGQSTASPIDVDGTTIAIDGTSAMNFTSSGGAVTIQGAGVNIGGGSAEVDITTSGAVDVNSTGGAVTIDGNTSVSINTNRLFADSTNTGIGTVTPQANSQLTVSGTSDRLIALENTTDAAVTELLTGTDPTGVTATTGSLFLEYDSTTGANAKTWINKSDTGSGTTWVELAAGAVCSLEDAYQAGNTINIVVGEGNLQFTANTADFVVDDGVNNLLQVTSTGAITLSAEAGQALSLDDSSGATGIVIDSNGAINIDNSGVVDKTIEIDGSQNVSISAGSNGGSASGTLTLFGTSASSWTTAGANLTLQTSDDGTNGGDVIVTAVLGTVAGGGNVDINATGGTTGVTIDATAAGVSIDGAGTSNFSTSSGNLTLSATGTGSDVVIDSDDQINLATVGSAGVNVGTDSSNEPDVTIYAANFVATTDTATDTELTLSCRATPVSADQTGITLITHDAVSADDIGGLLFIDAYNDAITLISGSEESGSETTGGILLINHGDQTTFRKVVDLQNDEGKGVLANDHSQAIYVSSNNPNTGDGSGTAGSAGDVCLVNDNGSGDGALFVNSDGTATGWVEVNTDANITLQDAYDAGNGITTASTIPIDFTLADGGFLVTTTSGNDLQVDNGSANFLKTDHANNELELGAASLQLNLIGDVNSNLTFDGTNRAVTNDGTGTLSVTKSGTSGSLTVSNTATAGDVILSSTNGVVQVSSGTLDVDTAIDFDGTSVDIEASGAVSIDADAASNFNVDGANLTLQTDTSGNIVINSVDAIDMDATAGSQFTVTGAGATTEGLVLQTVTNAHIRLDAAEDIIFDARSAVSPLTYNQTGDLDLTAYFSSTSIVGALNELAVDVGSVTETYPIINAVTIASGDLVYADDISGTTRVGLADADSGSSGDEVRNPIGVAISGGTGDAGGTVSAKVVLAGEVPVNSTGTPLVAADVGKFAFMSDVSGEVVNAANAPSTSGDTVLRVGIITSTTTMVLSMGVPFEV